MADDRELLPPLPLIRDRLTRNQRERSLLRALFRLAVRASQDQPQPEPHVARPDADEREVAHD